MSSSSSSNTVRALQEENHDLKVLVGQLKDEVKQKDVLIATLESQIAALVLVNRTASTEQDDSETIGDDDADTLSRISSLGLGSIAPTTTQQQQQQQQQGLPPRPPPGQFSAAPSSGGHNRSLHHQYSDDESPPPKPRMGVPGLPPPYPPTLRPPSRSNIEMKYPPAPTPQGSSDNGKSNKPQKNGTKNSKKKGEHHASNGSNGITNDEDDDGNKNDNQDPSASLPMKESGRKTLKSGKGAIKALPRELAIYNNDDDDVTKYSIDDGQPNYDVERIEFRDAYNARGIYTGSVQRAEQMPHGHGKMVYHVGGRFYEGEWHMGHWHGRGIIRNSEGDVYEGQVVNDLKQGSGKMTYADGRVFEGKFREDEAVEGSIVFPDGARYVGSLHNGARHGYGVYYFTDGSKYEGESVMNVFEGTGKMTWNDGGWYEGEWSQGEIHGFGKEIRADGSLRHDGRWSKGVPIRL